MDTEGHFQKQFPYPVERGHEARYGSGKGNFGLSLSKYIIHIYEVNKNKIKVLFLKKKINSTTGHKIHIPDSRSLIDIKKTLTEFEEKQF